MWCVSSLVKKVISQSQANEFQAQRVVRQLTGEAVYGQRRGLRGSLLHLHRVYILNFNESSEQLMIPVVILDLRLKLIINVVVLMISLLNYHIGRRSPLVFEFHLLITTIFNYFQIQLPFR